MLTQYSVSRMILIHVLFHMIDVWEVGVGEFVHELIWFWCFVYRAYCGQQHTLLLMN